MANSMISYSSDDFTLLKSIKTFESMFRGQTLYTCLKKGYYSPPELYGVTKSCIGKRGKGKRR